MTIDVTRAQFIADQLGTLERRLARLQGDIAELGVTLNNEAGVAELTPYATAGVRARYGELSGAIGRAIAAAVEMHDAAAVFDSRPQPQSGGGK